jgi:2-hydroxychromene-2-carboxylate isomerase
MAPARQIDFWFSMGSTYTYLTAMRLPEIEKATAIPFRWRPFNLLGILQEMKHVPFADKPAKAAYMWRDIERRAAMYGIPIRLPTPYPVRDSLRANQVAVLGMREGWGVDYVRAAYRRWFQLGQENGSEPNLSGSLAEIGQDPARVLAAVSGGSEAARLLDAETTAARGLGIFGSPTFAIERELFWGDDRLDDAITWYRRRSLAPPTARS